MFALATCARGLEPVVVAELEALGIRVPKPQDGTVSFSGTMVEIYRALVFSRCASRILVELASFEADGDAEFHARAMEVEWERHLPPGSSFAVDVVHRGTTWLRHGQYGAQRTKDAIFDRLRSRGAADLHVDLAEPEVRLCVRLRARRVGVFVDLAGESLHRRGYRERGALAPLKETLAAAILHRARWWPTEDPTVPLLDPMCGSGTFVIEAALAALDVAPGLARDRPGSPKWSGHVRTDYRATLDEARARVRPVPRGEILLGFDIDTTAIATARAAARRAGVLDMCRFEARALSELEVGSFSRPGLVVTNPPHGRRLGSASTLPSVYAALGTRLKACLPGWRGAIVVPDLELGRSLGLWADRRWLLHNGRDEIHLLSFAIRTHDRPDDAAPEVARAPEVAEAFANRLRKNLAKLRPWAAREHVECFRAYDADMPEYAVAVDVYGSFAHVQEYAPPATVDPAAAARRLREVVEAVPRVLGIPAEAVHLKVRRKRSPEDQYERIDHSGEEFQVGEGGLKFLVNLADRLDTGLFLDQRLTRARVRDLAAGRGFLNLFAYTGTASVYAASGGATSTTTVDLSQRYLDWAGRNLALNDFSGPEHRMVRADCSRFPTELPERERWGLVFLDPPVFSNSKRMRGTFDVQRDHVELIRSTVERLEPDGVLLFSTHLRRFRIEDEALADLDVRDVTSATIPRDFARTPRVHRCWEIRRRT